jgi:hypothetical protein
MNCTLNEVDKKSRRDDRIVEMDLGAEKSGRANVWIEMVLLFRAQ